MSSAAIARKALALLPAGVAMPARSVYLGVRSRLYRGKGVSCPCCGGTFSRFLNVGSPARPAACPGCDSRERHRLLHMYLHQRTNLFKEPVRLLHFAPEPCLYAELANSPNIDYLSGDLSSPMAMERIDITDIRFPDGTFDAILCSHVLEHILDDALAMRELYRVLRPGGWAILQVPMDPAREQTFEDPGITDPRERERMFGQWDHVRVYGRDYAQRLRGSGFHVTAVRFPAELGEAMISQCGLDRSEDVYHCIKRAR
jgi:SAM-dependent methyltransferase